jgi:1,4-alpha-glucan branching enzyme
VANFSTRSREAYSIGLPAEGRWLVRFNSDSRYYDGEFGDFGNSFVVAEPTGQDGLPARASVNVAGYSALILSQDGQ